MFSIKWSCEEVTKPMKEGVKQGCSLSPYLVNYLWKALFELFMKKMHICQ